MDERPTLHCLVARISADGWVMLLTRRGFPLMPFAEAADVRETSAPRDVAILIDPDDEIALAKYQRELDSFNQPKLRRPQCNDE